RAQQGEPGGLCGLSQHQYVHRSEMGARGKEAARPVSEIAKLGRRKRAAGARLKIGTVTEQKDPKTFSFSRRVARQIPIKKGRYPLTLSPAMLDSTHAPPGPNRLRPRTASHHPAGQSPRQSLLRRDCPSARRATRAASAGAIPQAEEPSLNPNADIPSPRSGMRVVGSV